MFAKQVFDLYLDQDLHEIGEASLPVHVGEMERGILKGPFVLQIDEVANVGASVAQKSAGGSNFDNKRRLCKLYITDGCTDIIGIETHFIKELSVLTEAGCKMLVQNVQIRRGSMLLSPLCVQILHGEVDRLIKKQKKTNVIDTSSSSHPSNVTNGKEPAQITSTPQTIRSNLNSLTPIRPSQERSEILRQMQQEQIRHHQQNIDIECQRRERNESIVNGAANMNVDSFNEMEVEKLMEIEAFAMAKKSSKYHPEITIDSTSEINEAKDNILSEGNDDVAIHIEERLLGGEDERVDADFQMDIPMPPSPPGSQRFVNLLTPPEIIEVEQNEMPRKNISNAEEIGTPSPLPSTSPPGPCLLSFQRVEEEINRMLENGDRTKIDSHSFVIKAVTKKITKFTCKKNCIIAILTVIDDDFTKCHVRFNSDLCERIIGMTVDEYKKKEKPMSKEEKKKFKVEVCQNFRALDKPLLYTIKYDTDPEFAYIPKAEDLPGNVSPSKSEGDDNVNNVNMNSLSGSQRAVLKNPLVIIKMSDPN